MRDLITKDIFTLSRILGKMNIKVDTKDKDQTQLGAELLFTFFENLHLAQDEVSEFLASLKGMTKEEFENLPVEKTMEIISELKNLPGLVNFFQLASK